eukprot:CCRYP_016156-RB/>CCRYP_016156-RB protein AED:0.05 eAED:0.05 QI:469/1/1/1/0/0/2/665/1012
MTPQEISLVTAISTSCLLSYLIPQCNSSGFLRSYFATTFQSLDERLESAIASNHNNASGGVFPYSGPRMKCLVDQYDVFTSVPFYRFLEQGLGAFLASGRAFTLLCDESTGRESMRNVSLCAGTDLLQLLGMSICPNVAIEGILQALGEGDVHEKESEAKLLASSTIPYSFQLSYEDRLRLVGLCANDLVVPEHVGEDGRSEIVVDDGTPKSRSMEKRMFYAATQQLRDSLFRFASCNAQSEKDACLAYKALVNIVVQEGKLCTIQLEFKRLLDVLLTSKSPVIAQAISECLSDLIARYNGSRYYADGLFTRDCLILLGTYIHERVLSGTEGNTFQKAPQIQAKRQQTVVCKTFHFVALLKVAKTLFYFLLDVDTIKKMEGDLHNQETVYDWKIEHEAKFQLLHDASRLLCFPHDISVIDAAGDLLALAFAYDPSYLCDIANIKELFVCTKKALENWGSKDRNDAATTCKRGVVVDSLKGVIYIVSRRSETYAFNLLSYGVKAKSYDQSFWHMASIIASVQPRIASTVLVDLKTAGTDVDAEVVMQQVLTHLSSSMIRNRDQSSFGFIKSLLPAIKDAHTNNWFLYRLVRHCFITGNFGMAGQILDEHLIRCCSQQTSFLWLTCLSRLAAGEHLLRANGNSAIPESLEKIISCRSAIASLAAPSYKTHKEHKFGDLGLFNFQLEVLKARIDYLHLVKTTKFTCSEFMQTSDYFKGETRSKLHLKNLPNCFMLLSLRYTKIYRLYGLHICQQSRSSLRGLISMCRILGELIDLVLLKKGRDNPEQDTRKRYCPIGDRSHPMGILLSRIHSEALPKMKPTEVKDSANVAEPELLDMVDAILKCQSPFPKSFFLLKPIPLVYAQLRWRCPMVRSTMSSKGQEMIDVTPGIPIKLMASGIIPVSFVESTTVSFSQVIAWSSVSYKGPLDDDDLEDTNGNESHDDVDSSSAYNTTTDPVTSCLLPEGKFILYIEFEPIIVVGYHKVVVQLGCRDICCGEWLLPTMNNLELVLRVIDG